VVIKQVRTLAFCRVKHSVGILLAAVIVSLLSRSVEYAKAAPVTPTLAIKVAPLELVPAQAGYIYVDGGYPLRVSITLDNAPLDVYWAGAGYIALFAFGFDELPGPHTIATQVFDPATGNTVEQSDTVTVLDFKYQLEQVAVPYRLSPLLDPEMNQDELDELSDIYAGRTRSANWDWPFSLPVPGGIVTSRFGGDRIYNGGVLAAHHAGIDFRRAISEPVYATANGRVVAAKPFDVRGNVIILDHGYGIFSQYAHLSELYVQSGQYVRSEQLIGAAGATGRVNGPHLHFEIIVNGIAVDPIRWFALAPGFVPPREFIPDKN
jgi:murein DD-endopeptidase MepM/ murein hydrolase activator NlpD